MPENAIAVFPNNHDYDLGNTDVSTATNKSLKPGDIVTTDDLQVRHRGTLITVHLAEGKKIVALRSTNVDERTGLLMANQKGWT